MSFKDKKNHKFLTTKERPNSWMYNKKGSLNLSIQAIVILVMAMAVLGLGLGFIRTMFAKGGDKLVGEIDNINIMKATSDSPIITTNTIKVKSGGNAQLQASVYNKDGTLSSGPDLFTLTAANIACQGTTPPTITCPGTINVPLDDSRAFGCVVKGGAATGLFTCQMKLTSTTATDLTSSFFVEVGN